MDDSFISTLYFFYTHYLYFPVVCLFLFSATWEIVISCYSHVQICHKGFKQKLWQRFVFKRTCRTLMKNIHGYFWIRSPSDLFSSLFLNRMHLKTSKIKRFSWQTFLCERIYMIVCRSCLIFSVMCRTVPVCFIVIQNDVSIPF